MNESEIVNEKMKIILITSGISRIVDPILSSNHNVIGIIESAPRIKKRGVKKQIIDIAFSVYHLLKEPVSLKKFADNKKVPYYYMENGCDEQLENWIKELNPDIIVVCSMSQLLKENIFNLPRYGTINLHPSLLPKYRGPNPDFWMYYNMDLNPGVTVHYIDKGEDTGDIIYQASYEIPLGIRSPDMLDIGIKEFGVPLILKALDSIAAGRAPRIVQPRESSTVRARNIKIEEYVNIIDWDKWSIEHIWHVLRGTESWLNAFEQPAGVYKGQRWIILDFEKCKMIGYVIGKVYKEKSKYFVVCSDGKIYLNVCFSLKKMIISLLGGR